MFRRIEADLSTILVQDIDVKKYDVNNSMCKTLMEF